MKHHKVELLSPAGEMAHVYMGIKNNVDAFYGGLKFWNARNKAKNFSFDEYNKVIKLCKKNNIKFYLTLNTLLKDHEIVKIINLFKDGALALPDAIILTDLGLINALNEELPQIEKHASTQFGSHCVDDTNYLESEDIKRAILSRELTINEIRTIKEKSNIKIEVFIWGSQCMSFSGMCYWGSLLGAGSGNRGKCIILCRDIYSCKNIHGHLMYMPDLDAISKIKDISFVDCIKLEGRRRDAGELAVIINRIHTNDRTVLSNGYLLGNSLPQNKLFEQVNCRIRVGKVISRADRLNSDDLVIKKENNTLKEIIKYSEAISGCDNYYYAYSEKNNEFEIGKKNVSIEINNSIDGIIKEILYVGNNGDSRLFNIEVSDVVHSIESIYRTMVNINQETVLYKFKYNKSDTGNYNISNKQIGEIVDFIRNSNTISNKARSDIKDSTSLYGRLSVEVDNIEIAQEIQNKYQNINIIYSINDMSDLDNVDAYSKQLGESVIFKLPIFDWESMGVEKYAQKLHNKKVMFTRISQLYNLRDVEFKYKCVDYSIPIWNRRALEYLNKFGINKFTATPELSFSDNKNIFENNNFEYIIAGHLPLIYTRNCFKHLLGCKKCSDNVPKEIFNVDKKLKFIVKCYKDHRILISGKPTLNDVSKINEIPTYTTFRYVTHNHSKDEVIRNIDSLIENNYHKKMLMSKYWEDSYECNLMESRD